MEFLEELAEEIFNDHKITSQKEVRYARDENLKDENVFLIEEEEQVLKVLQHIIQRSGLPIARHREDHNTRYSWVLETEEDDSGKTEKIYVYFAQ